MTNWLTVSMTFEHYESIETNTRDLYILFYIALFFIVDAEHFLFFVYRKMDIRLLLLLSATALVNGYRECPKQCHCNLDERGRIQTVCNRGGMSSIPIIDMDPNTEVLIIRGPRNDLTIGPIFLPLQKLEILRITDSNLPSVGTYSFWGVDRLRVLGK